MHRVDDVKEIFHHSNPLQRDALGLRQAICPLRQGGQAALVSGLMRGESWALRPGHRSGEGGRDFAAPWPSMASNSLARGWGEEGAHWMWGEGAEGRAAEGGY